MRASLLIPFLLVSSVSAQEPKATIKVDGGWPLSLAYSPDGKILASGGTISPKKEYKVHLWDTATNKEVRAFVGHEGPIYDLIFSPDGKVLASLSTFEVFLWDVATGKQIVLKSQMFDSVAFSPDSKTVATSGNSVQTWDLAGKELTRIDNGSRTIAFTTDGKTLVYGTHPGVVKYRDIATSKERRILKHEMDISAHLVISGDTLATTAYIQRPKEVFKILLWDIPSGKELEPLEGDPSIVYTLRFSADGKMIAAGCHDHKVRMWDVQPRKLVASVESDTHALALSPDRKRLATGGRDKTIKLWDIPELTKVK
jgi:WD40 repeat protein